jgi:menaquinone-dependent protoporphyrinogen oxidase
MAKHILITYASRAGTTAGVAESVAQVLREAGFKVDLLPIQQVASLSAYDAIVIGSAIQAAQWLPEAVQFVRSHQDALNQVPVAIFSVCMTLAMPNGEKYRRGVMDWIQPVRGLLKPVSEAVFAGALDLKKIPSFYDRLKFRISVALGVWKEGDHRDWMTIQTWAFSLPVVFK